MNKGIEKKRYLMKILDCLLRSYQLNLTLAHKN